MHLVTGFDSRSEYRRNIPRLRGIFFYQDLAKKNRSPITRWRFRLSFDANSVGFASRILTIARCKSYRCGLRYLVSQDAVYLQRYQILILTSHGKVCKAKRIDRTLLHIFLFKNLKIRIVIGYWFWRNRRLLRPVDFVGSLEIPIRSSEIEMQETTLVT